MKKRVLIVEEHAHFRKLLSMFLSKEFQVLPASNGLEAMGWISKGMLPNVIISGSGTRCDATEDFFNSLGCSGVFAHTPVIKLSEENVSKAVNLYDLQNHIMRLVGPVLRPQSTEPVLVAEGVEVVLN